MRNAECGFEDGSRIDGSDAFINPQSDIRIPKSEEVSYCLARAARVKLLTNHERHGLQSPTRTIMPRVLIADDQPAVIEALRLLLKGEGFETRAVASPSDVGEALARQTFDVALIDLNYTRDTTSGEEGLDLLTRMRELDPTLPVVVMTAWGSVALAVAALQRGAGGVVHDHWQHPRA